MLAYKEWLKLRPAFLALLAANAAFSLWLFVAIGARFRNEHAEMLFYQANHIGTLFYDPLRYVPLFTGIALGVAQFLPEITRGRLRLSMHLPVGLSSLVLQHLAIGLGFLLVILALDTAALALTIATFFPGAFVASALATAAPWLLAGVAGYLGTALVMLEPTRRFRATNLFVAGTIVWLCHLSDQYGAYERVLPGLALLVALLVPATLLPAFRYREGGRS
ncbi:MAG: hypothetical protein ACOC3D_04485 [Pseudomonadota bacterium]